MPKRSTSHFPRRKLQTCCLFPGAFRQANSIWLKMHWPVRALNFTLPVFAFSRASRLYLAGCDAAARTAAARAGVIRTGVARTEEIRTGVMAEFSLFSACREIPSLQP